MANSKGFAMVFVLLKRLSVILLFHNFDSHSLSAWLAFGISGVSELATENIRYLPIIL